MNIDEIIKTFLKEKDRRIFDQLSKEERDLVIQMLRQYRASGASPLLKECWDLDYDKRPPTLKEFVEDPYYLGATCGESLYPIWKDKLSEDLSPLSRKITLVFTGPIGIGKTYTGLAALLYKMTLLLLMKNPQKFYGIDKGSSIVFGIYAPTLAQASLAGWGTCLGFLKNSPFFQSMGVDPTQEYKKGEIQFPNNIKLLAGSKTIHTLGGNLFGHLMDETDFRIEADGDGAAHQIHTSLMRRMESRFMQKGGVIPGISILCSSANSQSGFLSKFIENNKDTETVAIHDHPIWEVKSHMGIYSGDMFKVDAGSATHNPTILTEPHATKQEIDKALLEMHPSARVLDVPVEYYQQFKDDIVGSIKDIAGCRVASTFRFFSNPEVILRNYDESIKNPVNVDAIPMSISNPRHIHEYLDTDKIFVIKRGIAQPRIHPECVRFAHLDLSKTGDSTGLVVGHLWRGGSSVIIDEEDSNLPVTMNSGHFYIDMSIEIQGKKGDPIDYSKIRAFLLWLRKSGMHLNTVTMDDFQSTDMIQILNKHGINAKYLSCDRTRQPYEFLKNMFMEDRITLHNHELLRDELIYLIDTGKKIDHEVSCFLGETRIRLLDGTTPSFVELSKKYKKDEYFWVYSQRRRKDGKMVFAPGRAKNSRITKKGATELVRVTLDDGTIIAGCSLDHKFMMHTGEYVEAKDLKEGMSLRPLYTKIEKKRRYGGYEMMQDADTSKWHYTHRSVVKSLRGAKTPKGHHIHHVDFKKLNNSPDNLKLMTAKDHFDLHAALVHRRYPEHLIAWSKSPEGRKIHSITSKRYWTDEKRREQGRRMKIKMSSRANREKVASVSRRQSQKRMGNLISKIPKEDLLLDASSGILLKEIAKKRSTSQDDIRKLQKHYFGFSTWSDFISSLNSEAQAQKRSQVSVEKNAKHVHTYKKAFQDRGLQKLKKMNLSQKKFDSLVREHTNLVTLKKKTRYTESQIKLAAKTYYTEKYPIRWSTFISEYFPEVLSRLKLTKRVKKVNHKVAKVEVYQTDPVDLWDIEVEEYHNFALDAGVYVHNSADFIPDGPASKDVCDALAGCVHTALTTPYTQVDMPVTSHMSVKQEEELNFRGMGYGSNLLDNPTEYLGEQYDFYEV